MHFLVLQHRDCIGPSPRIRGRVRGARGGAGGGSYGNYSITPASYSITPFAISSSYGNFSILITPALDKSVTVNIT